MKFLVTTFLSLMLMFGLTAQDTQFSDWDTDNDGLIEKHEFTSTFIDKYYHMWDVTDTKGVIEEDFFKESYAGLDTDGDQMLSDEEWLIGYNYIYDDYVVNGDIHVVDTDDDGEIEYAEYYDVLYETTFFTDIDVDSDNYISEYELAEYVFNNWDMNDSGILSRSEFNRFDWYYLDV